MTEVTFNLHQNQSIRHTGAPLETAEAAMVLVHGRGATATSILTLAPDLTWPATAGQLRLDGWAFLAPQAAGNTWYPNSFLAPIASNEPGITSGMEAIAGVLATLDQARIPAERTILLGFSQGACLALEFAARHARRYGGVVGLSGGLIGPDGTPRDYAGSLAGTPIFLGYSDVDPHIPRTRVEESAAVLRRLGGEVTMRLYRGMGHTVNQDEIDLVRVMMRNVGSVGGIAAINE
jgi:predicted esterase